MNEHEEEMQALEKDAAERQQAAESQYKEHDLDAWRASIDKAETDRKADVEKRRAEREALKATNPQGTKT